MRSVFAAFFCSFAPIFLRNVNAVGVAIKYPDGEEIAVHPNLIKYSITISAVMEATGTGDTSPLSGNMSSFPMIVPNVKDAKHAVELITKWCANRESFENREKHWDQNYVELTDWEEKFLSNINLDQLWDLICVSNFLNVADLNTVLSQWIANSIRYKDAKTISEEFFIPS